MIENEEKLENQENSTNDKKEDNEKVNLINENNEVNDEDKYELNEYSTTSKYLLLLFFFQWHQNVMLKVI